MIRTLLPILKKSHRETAPKALVAFLLLSLGIWASVAYYPLFKASIRRQPSVLLQLTPKFMRVRLEKMMQGGYPAYVAATHYFRGCQLVGSIMALLLAMAAVAREVETGTHEVLLSRPSPRWALLAGIWLPQAVHLAWPIFLSSLAIPLMGSEPGLPIPGLIACSAYVTLVVLTVHGYTFWLSTWIRSQSLVLLAGGAITMGMFITAWFTRFRQFTLFYYSDLDVYLGIMKGNPFPWTRAAALAGVVAFCFALSAVTFSRKDY